MTDREALQRRIRRFINRFVKLCEHQYWVYSKTSACSKHHWLCHSESCLLRAPLTPEACFPWRFSFSPWKRLQAIKLKRMSSPLQANDQIEYRSLYCEPPPPLALPIVSPETIPANKPLTFPEDAAEISWADASTEWVSLCSDETIRNSEVVTTFEVRNKMEGPPRVVAYVLFTLIRTTCRKQFARPFCYQQASISSSVAVHKYCVALKS